MKFELVQLRKQLNLGVHAPMDEMQRDRSPTVDGMTVVDLRSELRARGLKITGKKADLQERLLQHTYVCDARASEHFYLVYLHFMCVLNAL